MDSEKHRYFTGVPNEQILSNLQWTAQKRIPYWIRIPLIEGVNATEENIMQTISFLNTLEGPRPLICLLPYHDHGKGKHDRRGSQYNPQRIPMATPSDEVMARCGEAFRNAGFELR
jgi:pyruvate formate lyase activating enzyme